MKESAAGHNLVTEHTSVRQVRSGRLAWGPPIAWMALIFSLSAQSDPGSLAPVTFEGDHALAHLWMYFVLGALLWRAASASSNRSLRSRPWSWASAIGLAYGIADELHQSLVPGRTASVGDVVLDGIGVALGVAAAAVVAAWYATRERRDTGTTP